MANGVAPLGCYFRDLRPPLLGHRKFHPSIHSNSRPILPEVLVGSSTAIHDSIPVAILHHLRYAVHLILT